MKHKHFTLLTILVGFLMIASAWGMAVASDVLDNTSEVNTISLPLVFRAFVGIPFNQPPNVPTAVSPVDGAIDQSIEATLSWIGGDPDGDVVFYSVYLEADDDTPDVLVSSRQVTTIFDPGTLLDSTQYFWQIVATDEHGLVTISPVWEFTTVVLVNNPPDQPSNPSPEDDAIDQSTDVILSWTGGDPDGDAVTYDVYLAVDDDTPDTLVSSDQITTTFDPGILAEYSHYYWKIVATDSHGLVTDGPVWDFTTAILINEPPYIPSNPSPMDGATNQFIDANLSWTGGDPDGDVVTYDVYFEAGNDPPGVLVSTGQTATTFDPGTLNNSTQYYWQIVATDVHGAVTSGPVWDFTTGEYVVSERILIEAGEFQMGCDWDNNAGFSCPVFEIPLHTVYLDAYQIDVREVTNGLYSQCVASGVCMPPKFAYSETHDYYYGNAEFADHPVIYVDWYQAREYCVWSGGRLPTEAEWEKAARGSGNTDPFPWGDSLPDCTMANFATEWNDFCVGDTSAVGSYSTFASPYGIQDMSGNVWEWVNDWYDDEYYSTYPSLNPLGPLDGIFRVKRGGGWNTIDIGIRVAQRSWDLPTDEFDYVGFRCAYTP